MKQLVIMTVLFLAMACGSAEPGGEAEFFWGKDPVKEHKKKVAYTMATLPSIQEASNMSCDDLGALIARMDNWYADISTNLFKSQSAYIRWRTKGRLRMITALKETSQAIRRKTNTYQLLSDKKMIRGECKKELDE